MEEKYLSQSHSIGSGETALVQGEIELYTRQIEHEKINLSLAKERNLKQFFHLQKLRGKSVPDKEIIYHKTPKKRIPIIDRSPKTEKKINEEYFTIEINKNQEKLDFITNESNEVQLECHFTRTRIEELRKEKLKLMMQNSGLNTKIERLSVNIEDLSYYNMVNETDDKGAIRM